MNAAIEDFKTYIVEDALGHISHITSKRMFGGFGLYHDHRIFALITSDTGLYFKGDDSTTAQYADAGSTQFVYTGHTSRKPTPMPYWSVPEHILEDREKIAAWVHTAAALSAPKI